MIINNNNEYFSSLLTIRLLISQYFFFTLVNIQDLFPDELKYIFFIRYRICTNDNSQIRKTIERIDLFDADSRHWHQLANKELEESLSYHWNTKKAKNVILFVGDGMSPDTITASRIYRGGETSRLAWEHFPHIGILKVVSMGFSLDVIRISINLMFYM